MANRQPRLACAAAAAVLTVGCGAAGGEGGGADSGGKSSASPGSSSAPGMDGTVDPGRVFRDAELKKVLAPPGAFGEGVRSTGATVGNFNRYPGSRGPWQDCMPEGGSEPLKGYVRELETFRAASAERSANKWGIPDAEREPETVPEISVNQSLLSMPAEDAKRYLALQHDLYSHCKTVLQDMEAGVAYEHHEVTKLKGLGDETLLESSSITGGDEYETPRRYTVEARVGGVILRVGADDDKDKVLAWAAMLARDVGKHLYGNA